MTTEQQAGTRRETRQTVGKIVDLRPVEDAAFLSDARTLLLEGETVTRVFTSVRDGMMVTTNRLILADRKGISGKKTAFVSLPYRNVQVVEVVTAGHFDIDSEMTLWVLGYGSVELQFAHAEDAAAVARTIAQGML